MLSSRMAKTVGRKEKLKLGGSERLPNVELLRELRHLGATNRAGPPHHVAPFHRFLHGGLVVRNAPLLFAFHAKHFSQSIFPSLLCDLFVPRGEAIKGFGNVTGDSHNSWRKG